MVILVKSGLFSISQAKKMQNNAFNLPWFSFVLVLSMWICEKSLLVKAVVSSPSLKIVFVVQGFYIFILTQINSPASCL